MKRNKAETTVDVTNTTRSALPLGRLAAFAADAVAAAGLEGELSLSFVGARLMTRLNRQYRGRRGDTDVLSFNLDGPDDPPPPGEPAALGDVIICVPRAMKDAAEDGVKPEAHLRTLILHGILHLAGFDHETAADRAAMKKEEERAWKILTRKKTKK